MPIWDRLFGTYRDRDGFEPGVGFERAASGRWAAMLLAQDAHEASGDSPSPAR